MRFTLYSLLLIPLAACAPQAQTPPHPALPPPGPQQVELFNLTERTAAAEPGRITGDDLLAQVNTALQTPAAAARTLRLVQRYPDVALDLLRDLSAAHAAQPTYRAVASAYDHLFVAPGSGTWSDAVSNAVAHPQDCDRANTQRQQLLTAIEHGDSASAVASVALPPFVQAEQFRLKALAELVTDQIPQALQDLQSASRLAAPDASVSAELCLLQSIAEGRQNQPQNAAADWSAAAVRALNLRDPTLWQRLVDGRLDGVSWPAAVTQAFAPRSPDTVEGRLVRHIGQWHMSRGEWPAALLALKRAESLLPKSEAPQSELDEARVLFMMNQPGPAIAVLAPLTADPNATISHRAYALLGNAQADRGDLPGALDLLLHAVTGDDALAPADRAPGRADLGLVYLMSGQEKEGLDWLHRAQSDFAAAGDDGQLVQSLSNEAAYLAKTGRSDEANSLRQRAVGISSRFPSAHDIQ